MGVKGARRLDGVSFTPEDEEMLGILANSCERIWLVDGDHQHIFTYLKNLTKKLLETLASQEPKTGILFCLNDSKFNEKPKADALEFYQQYKDLGNLYVKVVKTKPQAADDFIHNARDYIADQVKKAQMKAKIKFTLVSEDDGLAKRLKLRACPWPKPGQSVDDLAEREIPTASFQQFAKKPEELFNALAGHDEDDDPG